MKQSGAIAVLDDREELEPELLRIIEALAAAAVDEDYAESQNQRGVEAA